MTSDESPSRLAVEVGALLRNLRQRRGLSQARLAMRAGVSQQWLSKIECGVANPTLLELERLFGGVRMRPRLEATPDGDATYEDPELALSMTDADRDAIAGENGYLLGKLADVPLLVGGRLAALAHGLPVRVRRLDLIVADGDRPRLASALRRFNLLRWSDRWQEFRDIIPADQPGPMRWLIGGKWELRVALVDRLPPVVDAAVGDLRVRVPPLPWLLEHDADLADLQGRLERLGAHRG